MKHGLWHKTLTCDFPLAHSPPKRFRFAHRPILDFRAEAAEELVFLKVRHPSAAGVSCLVDVTGTRCAGSTIFARHVCHQKLISVSVWRKSCVKLRWPNDGSPKIESFGMFLLLVKKYWIIIKILVCIIFMGYILSLSILKYFQIYINIYLCHFQFTPKYIFMLSINMSKYSSHLSLRI